MKFNNLFADTKRFYYGDLNTKNLVIGNIHLPNFSLLGIWLLTVWSIHSLTKLVWYSDPRYILKIECTTQVSVFYSQLISSPTFELENKFLIFSGCPNWIFPASKRHCDVVQICPVRQFLQSSTKSPLQNCPRLLTGQTSTLLDSR